MKVTSRSEAKVLGVSVYFTGKPCPHGHVSTRRVVNGQCVECGKIQSRKYYSENTDYFKRKKKEWSKNNKHYVYEYDRKMRLIDPSKNRYFAARYNQRKREATPKWLTNGQMCEMKNTYRHARDCEVVTGEKYHVDHIVPLISDVICGLHVPWNLQILPASENIRKGNAFAAE